MRLQNIFFLAALVFSFGVSPYSLAARAQTLAEELSGRILLQVEQNGEGWYVYPENLQRYFLGRPADAFEIMRELGLGISNENLNKLWDAENTFGPPIEYDQQLAQRLAGKILLQVEGNGEAWYVYPENLKRYYLGRPDDAFQLMRELGLGISDKNLLSIPVSPDSATAPNQGNRSDGTVTEDSLGDNYVQQRETLVQDMNAERAAAGLPDYTLVQELSDAAQQHADDMTAKQYFDFEAPDGTTVKKRVDNSGYVAHAIAQNLIQTDQGPGSVVQSWKNDNTTSYDNVVHEDYEHIGIGVGSYQGVPFYLVVFARSLESYFNEQTQQLQDLSAVRQRLIDSVNQERTSRGMEPFAVNNLLNQSAQGHADDMLARSYYSHESPEGEQPHERIEETGYDAAASAENIAKNQFSVDEVMTAWMNSPEHRVNILGDFEEVGFGMSFGENENGYEIFWVQHFGTEGE